jgi:hypothetical protein
MQWRQARFSRMPHLTLTFDELKARLTPTGEALCPAGPLLCRVDPRVILWLQPGSKATTEITSDVLVRIIPRSEGISRPRLQQIMANVAVTMCPHKRTDCPHFQRRLKAASCYAGYSIATPKRNKYPILVGKSHFARPFQRAKMLLHCSVKNCETTLDIHYSGNLLTARLCRNAGDLKMASDPKWCAQLEDWSDTAIEENRQAVQRMLAPPIFASHARYSGC